MPTKTANQLQATTFHLCKTRIIGFERSAKPTFAGKTSNADSFINLLNVLISSSLSFCNAAIIGKVAVFNTEFRVPEVNSGNFEL